MRNIYTMLIAAMLMLAGGVEAGAATPAGSQLIQSLFATQLPAASSATPSVPTGVPQAIGAAVQSQPMNTPALGSQTGSDQSMQPASPASSPVSPLKTSDYSANIKSDVFGASLFTGTFAQQGATQFNPDYSVAVGDSIQLRLWGGFEFDGVLVVDPQGNIFLPHVGPVHLLGVRNGELQKVVEQAVRNTYRANVYCYASLAAAQPVRVYVGGFANRPGLYNGTSLDSLLFYIDQAGGIDPERGSFIDIQVKRGETVRATINLYDFLLDGKMPLVQLADGDVIFVPFKHSEIKVAGTVDNAKRFQFDGPTITVKEAMLLARPSATTTHARITRNSGDLKNAEYFTIEQAASMELNDGDSIDFTSDKRPGTISVRVQGEHSGPQEYVLPYGSRLGDVLKQIKMTALSSPENIQLFRSSVQQRQKQMLAMSLKQLEASVLTARSSTNEEAVLRRSEADLILQWIERAKSIVPPGQVLIAKARERENLPLENGDIINIPSRDGLVLVGGEVLFPNAVAFEKGMNAEDYIDQAGGYTQNADTSRVVVAHLDGSFEENGRVNAGDQVLVIPRVSTKSVQLFKDISQIFFQLAILAKIAFPKL